MTVLKISRISWIIEKRLLTPKDVIKTCNSLNDQTRCNNLLCSREFVVF